MLFFRLMVYLEILKLIHLMMLTFKLMSKLLMHVFVVTSVVFMLIEIILLLVTESLMVWQLITIVLVFSLFPTRKIWVFSSFFIRLDILIRVWGSMFARSVFAVFLIDIIERHWLVFVRTTCLLIYFSTLVLIMTICVLSMAPAVFPLAFELLFCLGELLLIFLVRLLLLSLSLMFFLDHFFGLFLLTRHLLFLFLFVVRFFDVPLSSLLSMRIGHVKVILAVGLTIVLWVDRPGPLILRVLATGLMRIDSSGVLEVLVEVLSVRLVRRAIALRWRQRPSTSIAQLIVPAAQVVSPILIDTVFLGLRLMWGTAGLLARDERCRVGFLAALMMYGRAFMVHGAGAIMLEGEREVAD